MEHAGEASEDGELVRRIVARLADAPDAEAELCRRFAPRALLYGRRHLRDPDRARDLAQAVMVAVLVAVRADRVKDPGRIDRFILGTCRNVALRMREVDARAEVTDHAELEASAGAETAIAAASDALETIDKAALHRCMQGLETRARTVVHLSFHEEKSSAEIAAVLETTAGNVRVLRHRAVAELRKCLDDCREAPR